MANKNVLNLEGVSIGFRNFAGAEGRYNKQGDRNFVVFLDDAKAKELLSKGWNVKFPKENDDIDPEEDTRHPYLPVSLNFNGFPPKVVVIADGNASKLDESEVDMLDYADILDVDIVLNPYNWSVNGSTGIKAYCKAIYVTIDTDAFDAKYGI